MEIVNGVLIKMTDEDIASLKTMSVHQWSNFFEDNNITAINSGAFTNCSLLTEIALPGNLTLSSQMFINCENLKFVRIDNTCTLPDDIYEPLAVGCPNLTRVGISDITNMHEFYDLVPLYMFEINPEAEFEFSDLIKYYREIDTKLRSLEHYKEGDCSLRGLSDAALLDDKLFPQIARQICKKICMAVDSYVRETGLTADTSAFDSISKKHLKNPEQMIAKEQEPKNLSDEFVNQMIERYNEAMTQFSDLRKKAIKNLGNKLNKKLSNERI